MFAVELSVRSNFSTSVLGRLLLSALLTGILGSACLFMTACGATQQATVSPDPSPTPSSQLSITTDFLPVGAISQPYSFTLAAVSVNSSAAWSISAGVLPKGITLDEHSGLLSGTPQESGIFNLTIQLSDAGNTASRQMPLLVNSPSTFYHPYKEPGTYQVKLTVTDANGKTSTTVQTVTVTK